MAKNAKCIPSSSTVLVWYEIGVDLDHKSGSDRIDDRRQS
jgi:hypothetical protein